MTYALKITKGFSTRSNTYKKGEYWRNRRLNSTRSLSKASTYDSKKEAASLAKLMSRLSPIVMKPVLVEVVEK